METINEAKQALALFILENGIKAQAVRITERADGNQSDWDKEARHFSVTLTRGGNGTGKGPQAGQMTIEYSQGSAHTKTPTAADVLDCLAMDSSGDLSSFEDFCSEYGYDEDSRKAEALFKACQSIQIRFKKFLGHELYEELIAMERL